MNIVYLLTNKSKSEGKRFYVGSKSECKIVKINGVDTMVSVSNGKPYMSSSTSFEFKDDIAAGHIFEVTVLQELGHNKRKDLVKIENEWIIKRDAVNSAEYYNLGYAVLNSRDKGKLANRYGETVSELSQNNSNMSKRDGSARSFGYANYGEFAFDAYRIYLENGKNWSKAAEHFGKHKGYVRVALEPFDMEKAKKDLEVDRSLEIRKLLRERCSLPKACEILGIELPAGRVMLGDYLESRDYTVAANQGKTKLELEVEVTKLILDGEGFREVSNKLGITYESCKRYFFRCIRKRLKSSDL